SAGTRRAPPAVRGASDPRYRGGWARRNRRAGYTSGLPPGRARFATGSPSLQPPAPGQPGPPRGTPAGRPAEAGGGRGTSPHGGRDRVRGSWLPPRCTVLEVLRSLAADGHRVG